MKHRLLATNLCQLWIVSQLQALSTGSQSMVSFSPVSVQAGATLNAAALRDFMDAKGQWQAGVCGAESAIVVLVPCIDELQQSSDYID